MKKIISFLLVTLIAVAQENFPKNGVTLQIWKNVHNKTSEEFKEDNRFKNENPNRTILIKNFDFAELGENYVTCSSAILCPEKSGEYTFFLATDDDSQLLLGQGEKPENLREIAKIESYTSRHNFSNYGKSMPVFLEAGKSYYLRIVHRQIGGGDHVALAWQSKDISREIIPEKYLTPAIDGKKKKNLEDFIKVEREVEKILADVLVNSNNFSMCFLKTLSPQIIEALANYFKKVEKENENSQEKLLPYIKLAERIKPNAEKPIKDPAAKQLLYLENNYVNKNVTNKPHRLAETLGKISDNAKVENTSVKISSKPEKWGRNEQVSTGFYAVPGKSFKLRIPQNLVEKNLEIQIGHHNNAQANSGLISLPITTLRFPIKNSEENFVSPHGGLIFINVPAKEGFADAEIFAENVLKAPRFVLGKTTDEEWKNIRQNPAPWGEVISEHLVMIALSEDLQKLENPTELMTWWNENNAQHEDFYGYKPNYPFRMHAMLYAREGISYWPLEWHPSNIVGLLDIKKMHNFHSPLYLHEHGHHDDFWEMEIGFSSESTCNWAGYYMKEIKYFNWKDSHAQHLRSLFNPADKAHNEIKEKDWYKISTRGTHHWSYMVTSMMVGYAEDFTWRKIRDFLHVYRDFNGENFNQLPFLKGKFDDQAKIDRYLIGLSQQAQRDVRPYFAHFYYLPSEDATKFIDALNLPKWDCTFLDVEKENKSPKNKKFVISKINDKLLSMAKKSRIILNKETKNGTAKISANGDFVYTPNKDFIGTENIFYVLENEIGKSPQKSFAIIVE